MGSFAKKDLGELSRERGDDILDIIEYLVSDKINGITVISFTTFRVNEKVGIAIGEFHR